MRTVGGSTSFNAFTRLREGMAEQVLKLATCPDAAFRNGREAVRLATRACELTSDAKPLLIGTLAAAQAEAGDFQAAIAAAERAAVVAASLHLEKVAMRNRELLQLYRQGQPFHEKKGQ